MIGCATCNGTSGIYGCYIHSPYAPKLDESSNNYITWADLEKLFGEIKLKCPWCGISIKNKEYLNHRNIHVKQEVSHE